VLAIAGVLIAGVRQSARSNTVMVITKITVLLFFIVVALTAFNGDHFSDFAPNGFSGSSRRRRSSSSPTSASTRSRRPARSRSGRRAICRLRSSARS
jgi:amino acid transporter